jgi:cytoskeletal protein RodZ
VELLENEPEETGILAEPEPRYHTAVLPAEKTEHGQGIVRTLASILIGLILVVLIVLLARWIYHRVHHATVNTPSVNAPAQPNNSSPLTVNGSSPAASGSTRPGTSNPPASTPAPSSSSTPNTPSSTAGTLPNNGPGDVAAIFAGTSLAAAGLHYIISVRRFSRGES